MIPPEQIDDIVRILGFSGFALITAANFDIVHHHFNRDNEIMPPEIAVRILRQTMQQDVLLLPPSQSHEKDGQLNSAIINPMRREQAFSDLIKALNPSSPMAVSALSHLRNLFTLPTSVRGINLLPSEMTVLLKAFTSIQVLPPDSFRNPDSMVYFFCQLARVYYQILQSYLHQILVNQNSTAKSVHCGDLTARIRAECFTPNVSCLSIPSTDSLSLQELKQLEDSRSLLSDEDAVVVAKLLTAIWFRALPEARSTVTQLMPKLIPLVRRLLELQLSSNEKKIIELIINILSLPERWLYLVDCSNKIDDHHLKELYSRLRIALRPADLLEPTRGRDKTPRGIINEAIMHHGINVQVIIKNPGDSVIVIRANEDHLKSIVEEVAICQALLFPQIEKIRIEIGDRNPVELSMDAFYSNRIINNDSNYLRRLLDASDNFSLVCH